MEISDYTITHLGVYHVGNEGKIMIVDPPFASGMTVDVPAKKVSLSLLTCPADDESEDEDLEWGKGFTTVKIRDSQGPIKLELVHDDHDNYHVIVDSAMIGIVTIPGPENDLAVWYERTGDWWEKQLIVKKFLNIDYFSLDRGLFVQRTLSGDNSYLVYKVTDQQGLCGYAVDLWGIEVLNEPDYPGSYRDLTEQEALQLRLEPATVILNGLWNHIHKAA